MVDKDNAVLTPLRVRDINQHQWADTSQRSIGTCAHSRIRCRTKRDNEELRSQR